MAIYIVYGVHSQTKQTTIFKVFDTLDAAEAFRERMLLITNSPFAFSVQRHRVEH